MPTKRVIEQMVYTYEELSDKAKEKVLDKHYYHNVDYDWWDAVYDDAEMVGIKIEGFDTDRGAYCKIRFMGGAEETAHKIVDEHGDMCETYKTAKAYLEARDKLVDEWPRDEDGELEDEYGLDDKLDDLDGEFKHDISEDYRINLQKEYEYLTSREAIEESILNGDFEFDEEGNEI